MNFKSLVRAAKLPMFKKAYTLEDGTRVAVADRHMAIWGHDNERRCLNGKDEEVDPPDQATIGQVTNLISVGSPDLKDMTKVNSKFLKLVVGALDTKGTEPMYIQVHSNHICLAYEVDGDIHRGLIACMRREK